VVPIDGDVLRERRLRAFLTQRELAELAGYSAAFVSELETGRYQPGIDCLRALAGALACSPAALMSSEPAA
jgi:transcriptional regulator with XRE-family HTH domain